MTPNNYTPEVMETVMRVLSIHAPCHKVAGYEVEDIKQEGFLLAMKILEKWDGIRPLENFLVVSLANRLSTFVRDKHKLQGGFADITEKIMCPIDIDNVDWDTERCLIEGDNVSVEVEYNDLLRKIDEYLPISLRKDYLQMLAGVDINRGRRKKIREYISILLEELRGEGDD